MAKKWIKAKKQAYELQQGLCAICGYHVGKNYIGHHISTRKLKDHSVKNCQIRCVKCEVWSHSVDLEGNPTKQQIAVFLQLGEGNGTRQCTDV